MKRGRTLTAEWSRRMVPHNLLCYSLGQNVSLLRAHSASSGNATGDASIPGTVTNKEAAPVLSFSRNRRFDRPRVRPTHGRALTAGMLPQEASAPLTACAARRDGQRRADAWSDVAGYLAWSDEYGTQLARTSNSTRPPRPESSPSECRGSQPPWGVQLTAAPSPAVPGHALRCSRSASAAPEPPPRARAYP